MWFARCTVTTLLFLAGATLSRASALSYTPLLARRSDLNDLGYAASKRFEGDIERRSPQGTTSNGDLSLSAPNVEANATTLQACTSGMTSMTTVSNEAGFAACYNILDWHENMGGMFQADLRLFQFSSPTGQFANVPMNDITVQLNYPNSTQFSILMNAKRSLGSLQERQSAPSEIQQYSLVGNFRMQLDLTKLNSTQLMSLLIPQINLKASVNGADVLANVPASDTIYFVAGQFKGQVTPQIATQAANPATAAAAIDVSKGFVLPGTTFGIFPTGLIVTGAWCLIFLLAFGLGTLGRIRHRDIYRKRIAATSGRLGKK